MRIDPCMSIGGVLSLCAVEGWLQSERSPQNCCMSPVKTTGKAKKISKIVKKFLVKNFAWRKFSMALRGKKGTLVIITYIKIQNTALSICRGVAGPLETLAHNSLKDSY